MTSLNITPEQYLDADQVLMNVKSVILENSHLKFKVLMKVITH